jgi:hypothetical protein
MSRIVAIVQIVNRIELAKMLPHHEVLLFRRAADARRFSRVNDVDLVLIQDSLAEDDEAIVRQWLSEGPKVRCAFFGDGNAASEWSYYPYVNSPSSVTAFCKCVDDLLCDTAIQGGEKL